MNDNIIDLDLRRKDPHLSGKAKCTACGFEWVAVARVGTDRLECSSCNSMRGVWRNFCMGREGVPLRVCKCGCDVFALTAEELVCTSCGATQSEWYCGQDPAPLSPPPRRA